RPRRSATTSSWTSSSRSGRCAPAAAAPPDRPRRRPGAQPSSPGPTSVVGVGSVVVVVASVEVVVEVLGPGGRVVVVFSITVGGASTAPAVVVGATGERGPAVVVVSPCPRAGPTVLGAVGVAKVAGTAAGAGSAVLT